jgi:hypothetical protein
MLDPPKADEMKDKEHAHGVTARYVKTIDCDARRRVEEPVEEHYKQYR